MRIDFETYYAHVPEKIREFLPEAVDLIETSAENGTYCSDVGSDHHDGDRNQATTLEKTVMEMLSATNLRKPDLKQFSSSLGLKSHQSHKVGDFITAIAHKICQVVLDKEARTNRITQWIPKSMVDF